MPFESLSFRHTFNLPVFPEKWLPLIHLYDADLPLFPVYYFHVLSPTLRAGTRPSHTDRAFGYVARISWATNNTLDVTVVTNKDLSDPANAGYVLPVLIEVNERFGLANPVMQADIQNVFTPPLDVSNQVIVEMWHRVVASAYGNMLPFGRLWDEVLGLSRFVASWYSSKGRKNELIQTHYFASRFGRRIQSAGGIPQIDYYLLPTLNELLDRTNPLTIFPEYANLVDVADRFQTNYCQVINVSGTNFSKFTNPFGGSLDTTKLFQIFGGANIPHNLRPSATECFNSFDKGPQRTVIFLMMLDDLRKGRLNPAALNSAQCGSIYDGLGKTYQSPKVIQIYSQQSFGNPNALPVDSWIDTFFKWPLNVYPIPRIRNPLRYIFAHSRNLGKVERLLWVTAQARKVHSSACDDAVWCIKKGSTGNARGANPLACNICLDAIRNCCPAYDRIRATQISFNAPAPPGVQFSIITSAGNNVTPNQRFLKCEGESIHEDIVDDFSPNDNPSGFAPFPSHAGGLLTVDDFVRIY